MELLTLQEIAKRLDMPPSTVRHYKELYSDFMPGVKSGRYMKYEPEAVEVIQTIAEGYKNNLQQQDIREQLQAKFALNIEENETALTATTTATTKQQQPNLEQFNLLVDVIRDQAETIKQQAALIEQLTQQSRRRGWWPWRKGKH